MVALIGIDVGTAQRIAAAARRDLPADAVCVVANDNSPKQVVVSGTRNAIDYAVALARDEGCRKTVLLPVSAPFHSPLMAPAEPALESAFAVAEFRRPVVPLISNVTAEPVSDPAQIRSLLIAQLSHPVRWREVVIFLRAHGVSAFLEIGFGRILSNLVHQIEPGMVTLSLGSSLDLETAKASFTVPQRQSTAQGGS